MQEWEEKHTFLSLNNTETCAPKYLLPSFVTGLYGHGNRILTVIHRSNEGTQHTARKAPQSLCTI